MSYVPSPIHWLIGKYEEWRYPVLYLCPVPACILIGHKGDTHKDSHGIQFTLGLDPLTLSQGCPVSTSGSAAEIANRMAEHNAHDCSEHQPFDQPSPFSMGESFEP